MPRRKVVYYTSDESSSEEDTMNNFILAFGGLTVGQLERNATSPAGTSKSKFRFSDDEKVKVLQHQVKHAYTDKVPPATEIFLELVTSILPVPTDLRVAKPCVEAVRGLVRSVTKAAEERDLILTEDQGKGAWEVHVATALREWTGAGGWKAITLPATDKQSLLHGTDHGSMLVYRKIVEESGSKILWSRLVANALDYFARHRDDRPRAPASRPPITPVSRARQAYYVPSTYTNKSDTQMEAQRKAHRVMRRFISRTEAEAAGPDDEPLPAEYHKTLAWSEGLEFVVGKDYCEWQDKMIQGNKLIMEDLIEPQSEP
ncbi:hypothetical protein Slin14017_G128250 [Septoria linicola]|nr:hypothetical protein Slin14017_G128250 [Septoria linicola]